MAKEFLSRTGYLPIDVDAVIMLTGPVTSIGNATAISNSINLPGSPTTTTQPTSDNSTKIATTEFVKNVVTSEIPIIISAEKFNEAPSGTVDGANPVFTVTDPFAPNSTRVYLNGIRQIIGADYTETGPNEITFGDAPQSGDGLIIDYTKNI